MLFRREITLVFSICAVCHTVIGFQKSMRRETLCSNGEPVVLNCSDGHVISIEKAESENHKCNLECDTKLLERVKVLCNGNITCNVTSDIFQNDCRRCSRYLDTYIGCKFWAGTDYRRFDVCSNKLSKIHCDNFFWRHRIRFKSVSVKSQSECDNEADIPCLLDRLKSLCDKKEYCSEEVEDSSCLFKKQYMHIYYSCSDISTQSNASTEAIASTLPDISKTTTGKTITEPTESNQEKDMVALSGSLLLVKYELQSKSQVLCSDDWNDKAATVVCKFLNLSRLGRAINLPKPEQYDIFDVYLNCTGQEGSLQECDFIDKPCSSTLVAGVCCDDEEDCLNQSVVISPPSQKSTGNTETSYTGLAVGLAVIAVTALVGTLVVIYLRHRGRLKFMCFDKLKKPSRYTSDNDYLGQQGISLPESSRGNARLEINNDNNENETLYENQPKHPIDSTENAQFYSLASSPEDQTQYATAKEGEYDVTNSRRHVANDGNLYDHSVDTVYDSTGNQGSNPTSDSTYARTVDNVYDGTARKRTNDQGTDGVSLGTYNHSSETAYDVRFFNKSQSNHYDA